MKAVIVFSADRTAYHILTLIELNNIRDIPNTSENLALSVNTNPVVVRRIMAMLKSAELVEVKAGIGAAFLRRKPENITWLDVFHAVNGDENFILIKRHENPNADCYVGAYILDVLEIRCLLFKKPRINWLHLL